MSELTRQTGFNRKLGWLSILGITAVCLLPGPVVLGQEERRERESRDERRERQRKASENPRLERERDNLGRDSDRLGREDQKLNRDSDRLDRKSENAGRDGERASNDGNRLAKEGKPARDARSERGFASRESFEDHYQKHQAEFGKISREDYLRKAQTLRDSPPDGKNVKEIRRGDDRITKYDTRANEFGVYQRDGTVVTFFRPTDGERYFERQAETRK